MGIILNTANAIFMIANLVRNIVARSSDVPIVSWYMMSMMIAKLLSMMFIAGQARAIFNSSCRGCLRYCGLYCTALHRPKPIKKIRINQIGSICANGLGVNLPCRRGVGSHNLFAIRAWAYSCKDILTTKIMIKKSVSGLNKFSR